MPDNNSAVRLVIAGLFDGLVKRVGDQVAFVAQAEKVRMGVYVGTLDATEVRLMITFVAGQERARPPMLIATILP